MKRKIIKWLLVIISVLIFAFIINKFIYKTEVSRTGVNQKSFLSMEEIIKRTDNIREVEEFPKDKSLIREDIEDLEQNWIVYRKDGKSKVYFLTGGGAPRILYVMSFGGKMYVFRNEMLEGTSADVKVWLVEVEANKKIDELKVQKVVKEKGYIEFFIYRISEIIGVG